MLSFFPTGVGAAAPRPRGPSSSHVDTAAPSPAPTTVNPGTGGSRPPPAHPQRHLSAAARDTPGLVRPSAARCQLRAPISASIGRRPRVNHWRPAEAPKQTAHGGAVYHHGYRLDLRHLSRDEAPALLAFCSAFTSKLSANSCSLRYETSSQLHSPTGDASYQYSI